MGEKFKENGSVTQGLKMKLTILIVFCMNAQKKFSEFQLSELQKKIKWIFSN